MDAHEVTMGDYKQATDGLLPVMFKNRSNLSPDDFPVTEIFVDEAIAYAERIGKRLITEFEYEFVATNGGKTRFPWGQDWRSEVRWTLSPVGSDSVDRTLSDPPVFGLFSNASEMTSSWFVPYPNPDNLESIAARMAGFTYVIRGGPIAPPRVDSAKQLTDAWTENGVPYRIPYSSLPAQRPSNQIGFRCARSVSPIVGP